MNVLKQNLGPRLVSIVMITLIVSLAFYFLEYSNWAETIRQTVQAAEPQESPSDRSYLVMVAASLAKATMLIGIPLSLTLATNWLWQKLK